jgi:hypothetical protein
MGGVLEFIAAAGLIWGFLELFKPSRRKHPFHW